MRRIDPFDGVTGACLTAHRPTHRPSASRDAPDSTCASAWQPGNTVPQNGRCCVFAGTRNLRFGFDHIDRGLGVPCHNTTPGTGGIAPQRC
jgi:hypothetical protein